MSTSMEPKEKESSGGSYHQVKERVNISENMPRIKCSSVNKNLIEFSCSHKVCFNCIFKYFLSSSFKGISMAYINLKCPQCQQGEIEINLDDYIEILKLLLYQKNPNFGQEDENNNTNTNNNNYEEDLSALNSCKIHKDKKIIKYCKQCCINLCEKCLREIHNRSFPNHTLVNASQRKGTNNSRTASAKNRNLSPLENIRNNKEINELQEKETIFMQKLESESIMIQTKVNQIIKDLNFLMENYINKINVFQDNMRKIFQIINLAYYNYYTSNDSDKKEITITKKLNDFNITSKKIDFNEINNTIQRTLKEFGPEKSIFNFEFQWLGENYKKKFELVTKNDSENKPDCITKIIEIKNSNRIVASLISGQIYIWDILSKNLDSSINAHKSAIWSMIKLSNDMVVSGSSDKMIKVWNILGGSTEPFIKLRGHKGTVFCLAEMEQNKLLSGSDDRTIKLWDLINKKCLMVLEDPNGSKVNCLMVLPDPGFIVTGGDDNLLKIWNIYSDYIPNTLAGHECTIWSITSIVDDSSIIASGSSDNTIKVWDLVSLKCLFTLEGHENSVSSLKLLNNNLLISSSWDKYIKIWNLKTRKCITTLKGHTNIVWDIIQLDNGDLASCSSDMKIIIWGKEE